MEIELQLSEKEWTIQKSHCDNLNTKLFSFIAIKHHAQK